MKFAHMADLHLGGWRDPELERLNLSAFEKALDACMTEKVDFVLVSGDFFDTSMPPFDVLDFVSRKLNEVKKAGIPVYTISGSHDYSPSGKTVLKILENAELLTNVANGEENDGKIFLKFTTDGKTGVKLTGIIGRKGSLDREDYKKLDREIEKEPGYKIFLFHAGIEEYKPDYFKDVEAMPLSLLPKGFDYYAGGHIHYRDEQTHGQGKVVFPGPLFPCNFQELERLKSGGFYIVEDRLSKFVEIKEREIQVLKVDADKKSAMAVELELEEKVSKLSGKDFILLIKVSGTLREGRPSDINLRRISEEAAKKGAAVVRRSTSGLASKEYDEVAVSSDTVENLEAKIITEGAGKSEVNEAAIRALMKALDTEKAEGETTATFEERVVREAGSLNKSQR